MPGWLRATGLKPMSLGLDLRGGVYFLYEVDVAGAVKQLLGSMERDYRTLLRDERIPFTGIQAQGGTPCASRCAAATTSRRWWPHCASATRTSRSNRTGSARGAR